MTSNTRIADTDRHATEDRLRAAHAEGRITADELVDRLFRVATAQTRGDLAGLVADLPRQRLRIDSHDLVDLATKAWIVINIANFTVWLMTSLISGHVESPWFLWSLVIPGVGLAALRHRRKQVGPAPH